MRPFNMVYLKHDSEILIQILRWEQQYLIFSDVIRDQIV